LPFSSGFPLGPGRGLHPNCARFPFGLCGGFPLAFEFPSRLREGYRSRTCGCHRQFARAQLCGPRLLLRVSLRPSPGFPAALGRRLHPNRVARTSKAGGSIAVRVQRAKS